MVAVACLCIPAHQLFVAHVAAMDKLPPPLSVSAIYGHVHTKRRLRLQTALVYWLAAVSSKQEKTDSQNRLPLFPKNFRRELSSVT